MGFFTEGQKAVATKQYDKMKQYLKPKDGKIHVLMIDSSGKSIHAFGCEDKYTTEIDEIISCMQDDGFEILDIKFNIFEGFHTLVTYK